MVTPENIKIIKDGETIRALKMNFDVDCRQGLITGIIEKLCLDEKNNFILVDNVKTGERTIKTELDVFTLKELKQAGECIEIHITKLIPLNE